MSGPVVVKQTSQPTTGNALFHAHTGTPTAWPQPAAVSGQVDRAVFVGEGLLARLRKVNGVTPKGVLDSPVYLPAMLNTLSVVTPTNFSDYQTLADGQFSQAPMGGARSRQLKTADLDALVLTYDVPWLVATGQDPDQVLDALQRVTDTQKPAELLLTLRPGNEVERRMNITIRQLTVELRGGERDARYLTLSIEEWRDPQVGRRSSQNSRKRGVKLPTTHALKAGDTLHSLSMAYYGSYQHWRAIRDANGISKRFGATTPLVSADAAARPGPGGAVGFRAGHRLKIPKVAR